MAYRDDDDDDDYETSNRSVSSPIAAVVESYFPIVAVDLSTAEGMTVPHSDSRSRIRRQVGDLRVYCHRWPLAALAVSSDSFWSIRTGKDTSCIGCEA